MANKYVIGKATPVDEPVRVWLEEFSSGAVALCASCSGGAQSVARLTPDGRLIISPMDESAARAMGLQIDAKGKIVVV